METIRYVVRSWKREALGSLVLHEGDLIEVKTIQKKMGIGKVLGEEYEGRFPLECTIPSLCKKATWSFEPVVDDELPLKEGDIYIVITEEEDWSVVSNLRGEQGLVPTNRLENISITEAYIALKNPSTRTRKVSKKSRYYVVHDFVPSWENELSLKRGNVVEVTSNNNGQYYGSVVVGANLRAEGWFSKDVVIPDKRRRVLFDYIAEKEIDLSIKKGEIIVLILVDQSGWGEAYNSDGKRGWVPTNFLENLKEDNGEQMNPERVEENLNQKRVLYDYNAGTVDELSIKQGEILVILQEVPGGWVEARNANKMLGWVPANYLGPLNEEEKMNLPKSDENFYPNQQEVRKIVLYDYSAMENDELSVKEGEIVVIIDEDVMWGTVRDKNGRIGLVPLNYLGPMNEEKEPNAEYQNDKSNLNLQNEEVINRENIEVSEDVQQRNSACIIS